MWGLVFEATSVATPFVDAFRQCFRKEFSLGRWEKALGGDARLAVEVDQACLGQRVDVDFKARDKSCLPR